MQEVFPEGPFWPEEFKLFEYAGHDRSETAQWARHNEFVGRMTMILQKVDRASMHESLEVRVPLLDRRVVEVASRTDWESCLDLDRRLGKLPLRSLLSRHVKHQTQAKRGFTVPMGVWLKGPLRRVFEDEVLSRKKFLGYPVNQPALHRNFTAFLSGTLDEAWGLWLLLSLSFWGKAHYRGMHDWHAPAARLSAQDGGLLMDSCPHCSTLSPIRTATWVNRLS
jgi:asparagine synthase (glutamine-hydrolysing)